MNHCGSNLFFMSGTILIAIAMVGAIVLTVFLFIIHGKKQKAKKQAELRRTFKQAGEENGLLISYKEEHSNMILAIDELKMLLLFTRHDNEAVQNEIIPLERVTDCFVKKTGVKITNGGKGVAEEHVSAVHLSFKFMNAADADLLIYNEVHDGLFEKIPLTRLAENWQQRIKETLIVQHK